MLKRYLDRQDVLPRLQVQDIDELLLTERQSEEVEEICIVFHGMDTTTKGLQLDNVTLEETRALFLMVMASFPDTERRLVLDVNFVLTPSFKSAIGKTQYGPSFALTDEERQSGEFLKKMNKLQCEMENTFAEQALKRLKKVQTEVDKYRD